MNEELKEMLDEWNDPLNSRTMPRAKQLIRELQIELAGKNALIDLLHDDLNYYKRDRKDQMIQDQGLEE